MPPRLKVFVTSDGLTDFVVAATSKTKALAAWGSHQDLFKTGSAHETDEPDIVAAASKTPGQVLRRPAGTRGELAKIKPAKAAPSPAKPSKAALKKIADLEKRLADLEEAHADAVGKVAAERAKLERRAAKLEAEHAAQRQKVEAALSASRRALG